MGNSLIDSLLLEVNATTDYNQRSILYKKIADRFYATNLDSVDNYYVKSLAAAKKSATHKDDITVLRSFAHLYGNRKNDYVTAKQYLKEAFQVAEDQKDNIELAVVKNDLGVMAKKEGNFQEAINCFFEAYKIIRKEDDDNVRMRILLSLGVIHNETSYNEKAKEYYKEALLLAEKVGHKKMKGVILNNLSKICRDLENFEESDQYLKQALSVFESLQDSYWKGLVLYNFGYNHFLKEEYEQAISYYNRSLKLNEIIKEKEREVMLVTSLAEVYAALNQHQKAIAYSLEGLDLLKSIKTTEYHPSLNAILGKCYQKAGDYEKSSYYLQQHLLAEEKQKEENHSSKIGQMQAMHENELKAAAVNRLELKIIADEAVQQKTSLLLRLLLISFVLIVTILGLLFYRNKLKQTEKNYQLRNQLARDLHDNIGASLNQIKIMLGRFSRKVKSEQTEIKTVQTISNNIIANMYDLVWSLDKEKEQIDDLLEYMRDHASNILSPLQIPLSIKINNEEDNKPIPAEVKNNIYSIFKEAVNNIVKHTQPKDVAIKIAVRDNILSLFIQNDKQELLKEKISSGLGLINIKKRAALINGELKILDEEDKFIVDLTVKLLP